MMNRRPQPEVGEAVTEDESSFSEMDLDIDVFRNSVLTHLAHKDVDGLRMDADAVMAPIFVEKIIDDIQPGNPWNDVLYLMASKLMEIAPPLRNGLEELEAKRQFVNRPGADLTDLMVVENDDKGLTLRLRDDDGGSRKRRRGIRGRFRR